MYPLQTILLALLVLTAGELPSGEQPQWWPIAGAGAVLLITMLVARVRTAASVRRLAMPDALVDTELYEIGRLVSHLRWVTLAVLGAVLFGTGGRAAVLGLGRVLQWPGVPEMVFLLPVALVWIVFWWFQFDVEASGRNQVIAERLALQLPVHDFPTRIGYVFLQIRHNFYILLIIVVKVFVERGIAAVPAVRERDWLSGLLTFGCFILFLALLPLALTRLWNTVRMTGPLRDRLDAVAAANRLRFRDIRIWRTHHLIPNAAILGPLPRFRYFLMTDALLEALDDDGAEAVFAHEVGHGVCHHLIWYVAALLGAGALCDALTDFSIRGLDHFGWHVADAYADVISLVPLGLFLMFGFSRISRQFEHQADWFATRYLGREIERERAEYLHPAVVDAGNSAAVDVAVPAALVPALVEGAQRFSAALGEIVRLSHRPQSRGGWMHPAPRRRTRFLLDLAADPTLRRKFERRMVVIRVGIAALAAVGVAGAIVDSYIG